MSSPGWWSQNVPIISAFLSCTQLINSMETKGDNAINGIVCYRVMVNFCDPTTTTQRAFPRHAHPVSITGSIYDNLCNFMSLWLSAVSHISAAECQTGFSRCDWFPLQAVFAESHAQL